MKYTVTIQAHCARLVAVFILAAFRVVGCGFGYGRDVPSPALPVQFSMRLEDWPEARTSTSKPDSQVHTASPQVSICIRCP